MDWGIITNSQTFRSPLSGSVQTLELPGARWRVTLTFNNLKRAERAALKAFLAQLRGPAGRFTLHNFAEPTPQGAATGTPLVNGASQTGASLATDGWTPNITGILKAGDYFAVGGELKIITADASSNGSGQATLEFEPPLRASPADNASITTSQPTATFMLQDDDQARGAYKGAVGSYSFTALESWI
jgi:hypothetical protein